MYIIIMGCGRVGSELAKLLSLEDYDVVIIDKKESSFARLGGAFNGITVKGSGISPKTLQEANIHKADIFCAFTNSDNVNIMAAQVARGIFKVPRVIARVYDPQKAAIYKTFGLDVLSEPVLFASLIRDKIVDHHFSSYLIESNELGLFEFPVQNGLAGKMIEEVNISGELNITAILRKDQPAIIPDTKTTLRLGDRLIAVVKMKDIKRIKGQLNIQDIKE
jgi:trk system potassium uptake protein TrkA